MNKKPIQKEEVKELKDFNGNWIGIEENKIMTREEFESKYPDIKLPTTSDTFIEEKMKELKELLKCGDKNCQEGHYPIGYDAENDEVEWGGCPNCVVGDKYLPRVDPYKLETFLKSSLQEQRQSILEEIEKKIKELGIQTDKADTQIQNEDFNEFFSKEDAEKLIHDNLIIIKALEDIKQLLK